MIAVKKLWRIKKDNQQVDAFTSEIQTLGHIRHRNIVNLLSYCSNKCVKLLLYNYISYGNLQQLLQDNRSLEWETKYKIAVGSAQGLAYLHHDCVSVIINRDVKCNNILLDSKYETYSADFGLAKLMNSPNFQHAMSRVAGSYGYIAPGYTDSLANSLSKNLMRTRRCCSNQYWMVGWACGRSPWFSNNLRYWHSSSPISILESLVGVKFPKEFVFGTAASVYQVEEMAQKEGNGAEGRQGTF